MDNFICEIKLPEETEPENYIKDNNCFDCGTELIKNENCVTFAYDIHQLICPQCKARYIKCMRTGYLKKV